MVRSDIPDSEWRTGKCLIDPKLQAAGWRVVPYDPAHPLGTGSPVAIQEFPTENGPADYALCADGQLLGVVEAKKLTLGPQNALTQAERYARGATANPFNFHGFRVPFLYATNGEVLWHHDVRHPQSRSRRIAHFHTPDALGSWAILRACARGAEMIREFSQLREVVT